MSLWRENAGPSLPPATLPETLLHQNPKDINFNFRVMFPPGFATLSVEASLDLFDVVAPESDHRFYTSPIHLKCLAHRRRDIRHASGLNRRNARLPSSPLAKSSSAASRLSSWVSNINTLSNSGANGNKRRPFKTRWLGKSVLPKPSRNKRVLLAVLLLASSAAALTSLGVRRAVRGAEPCSWSRGGQWRRWRVSDNQSSLNETQRICLRWRQADNE